VSHVPFIVFLLVFGACVGSFINVVVWRVPRDGWRSLVNPRWSFCPSCRHGLAWYDNIPVVAWLMLRGRCRYCGKPISLRYPLVELGAGVLFAFYYVMLFIFHAGPRAPRAVVLPSTLFGEIRVEPVMTGIAADWPIFALYLLLIAVLLAVTLIDLEWYIIPVGLPWFLAAAGMVVHTLVDGPTVPGALCVDPGGVAGIMAGGGAIGLLLSGVLLWCGVFKPSFPDGEPALDVDEELSRREGAEELPHLSSAPSFTPEQMRQQIAREIVFLLPPLLGALAAGCAALYVKPFALFWLNILQQAHWLAGLLGSLLGAMTGALLVWVARIAGTLAWRRLAMGLGDVHLMFGVGAVIGAGPVVLAFFMAPFAALAVHLWGFLGGKGRELPYGPYLSLASAAAVLLYAPVADYFGPGLAGLAVVLRRLLGAA